MMEYTIKTNEDQNTTGALWGVWEDVQDFLSSFSYNKQLNFRCTAFITWKTKIKIFDCDWLAWRLSNVALLIWIFSTQKSSYRNQFF